MALNEWVVAGDSAIIFLRRHFEPMLACWIDKKHLRKALTRVWIPKWNPTSQTFYARCNGSKDWPGAYLHRYLLDVTDRAIEIDHKDHDGLNNRKSNLRIGNRSINQFNRHGADRDKMYNPYRHVYWNKNLECYWVGFEFGGKKYHFGTFYNLDEAVKAAENGRQLINLDAEASAWRRSCQ